MSGFTEPVVEEDAIEWFAALGHTIAGGPSIAPGEPSQERRTYADVVLDGRLRDTRARLNPTVSHEGLEETLRKLTRISSPQPIDELAFYDALEVSDTAVKILGDAATNTVLQQAELLSESWAGPAS